MMTVPPRSLVGNHPQPPPVAPEGTTTNGQVERASSEVLYSSAGAGFSRSRRSLAEPHSGCTDNDLVIDKFHSQPPMLAPISGVPNLKVHKI